MGKHTTDLVYEVWKPKWKHFQPPINARLFGIPLFRWAYHIHTKIFTNVYPIAMSTGSNAQRQSMEFEFNVNQVPISPEIDAATSELKRHYVSWLNREKETEEK